MDNICRVKSAVCYTKSCKLVIRYDITKSPKKGQKVKVHLAAPMSLLLVDLKDIKKGKNKTGTIKLKKGVVTTIKKARKDHRWCDCYTYKGKKQSSWSTVNIICKNS